MEVLGGHGALHLKLGSQETDSLFVQWRKEDDYQKRLAVLLAEIRGRPAVPSVVTVNLLPLLEDLCRLYFMSNRSYWWPKFHFEARVWERQNLLAGWQNLEIFSMRISVRPSSYCVFPD